MACKYQHWIVPYLDGQVEASREEELKAHIKGCSGCMKELKVHEKLGRILRSLDTVVGVHERLANNPRWSGQPRVTFVPGSASKIVKKRKWKIVKRPKLSEQEENHTKQE